MGNISGEWRSLRKPGYPSGNNRFDLDPVSDSSQGPIWSGRGRHWHWHGTGTGWPNPDPAIKHSRITRAGPALARAITPALSPTPRAIGPALSRRHLNCATPSSLHTATITLFPNYLQGRPFSPTFYVPILCLIVICQKLVGFKTSTLKMSFVRIFNLSRAILSG